MLFEAFLGQGYKSCLFSTSGGKKKEREKKCKLFFFLSLWQRVTFFDISTESLVLQHLLPDASIESPMSNRKRNKCFIELELSLVIVGGRKGRGELASMWVSVGVSSVAEGYAQTSV